MRALTWLAGTFDACRQTEKCQTEREEAVGWLLRLVVARQRPDRQMMVPAAVRAATAAAATATTATVQAKRQSERARVCRPNLARCHSKLACSSTPLLASRAYEMNETAVANSRAERFNGQTGDERAPVWPTLQMPSGEQRRWKELVAVRVHQKPARKFGVVGVVVYPLLGRAASI